VRALIPIQTGEKLDPARADEKAMWAVIADLQDAGISDPWCEVERVMEAFKAQRRRGRVIKDSPWASKSVRGQRLQLFYKSATAAALSLGTVTSSAAMNDWSSPPRTV
jgi:hypothetical protein